MKKTKAFTLIEILLASFIFMIVVTIAVSALSMMRRSTETSDDLSQAVGCARALEDFVKPEIQLAQFGNRFYGINTNGSDYLVGEIPSDGTSPSQYSGLAILNSEKEATLIFKSADDGVYKFGTVSSMNLVEIQGKLNDANWRNGAASKIQSDSCQAFFASGLSADSQAVFGFAFNKPFKITKATVKDGFYHHLTVTDYDFSKSLTQTEAIERQNYARVFIDVVVAREGV